MTVTIRALLATSALLCATPLQAQDFGAYGHDTMHDLALGFAGRYTGSTVFPRAADYVAGRLSFGGSTVARQGFASTRGPSQNLLVSMPGTSDRVIVVGAHFDSAGTLPDLQGVDDNASGTGVLTELAAHMSGLDTETGLVFAAFGAEEIGLQGSRHYIESLDARQRANLADMINIDSLITGDFMYGHAGSNYLDNPALLSFWSRAHAIAEELGIDLRSNPGLNPDHPILTGCCSDAEPFEALDIPILWLEATNWQIGDLDGYTQTDNPDIPGGSTWHDPTEDNWEFLLAALGPERFEQRMRDYARLLTRLLVEETDADLIASARSAGLTGAQMADLTRRQQRDLSELTMRATRDRLVVPGDIGAITADVSVQGLARPEGSWTLGQDRGGALMARVGAAWQIAPALSLGGQLAYARTGEDLDRGGDLSSTGLQASLDAAWQQQSDWAVAAISYGRADLSGDRSFRLMSGLGAVILDETFELDTRGRTLGARVEAGRDLQTATGLTYGPVLGLDYARTRISGITEQRTGRTAIRYGGQDFESLEVQLGGRVAQAVQVAGREIGLSARASWVRELADGAPGALTVIDSEGTARRVSLAGQDRSFGRVGLSAQMALSSEASGWVTLDTRIGHDAGAQTTLGAGVGLHF